MEGGRVREGVRLFEDLANSEWFEGAVRAARFWNFVLELF